MIDVIKQKLSEIEKTHDVKILFAAESGSRAWDFASPDSDYDVRFIYARPYTDYLKLNPSRDVIELPINDDLDINGWDVKKALSLLNKSNISIFEWFGSPIRYKTSEWSDSLEGTLPDLFNPREAVYHYYRMARKCDMTALDNDHVSVKKYLYALRAGLAADYIIRNKTVPPIKFFDLVLEYPGIDPDIRKTILYLMELKSYSCEDNKVPKNLELNVFIHSLIGKASENADSMKTEYSEDTFNAQMAYLNRMMLNALDIRE